MKLNIQANQLPGPLQQAFLHPRMMGSRQYLNQSHQQVEGASTSDVAPFSLELLMRWRTGLTPLSELDGDARFLRFGIDAKLTRPHTKPWTSDAGVIQYNNHNE